jgi:hypothetical protein
VHAFVDVYGVDWIDWQDAEEAAGHDVDVQGIAAEDRERE